MSIPAKSPYHHPTHDEQVVTAKRWLKRQTYIPSPSRLRDLAGVSFKAAQEALGGQKATMDKAAARASCLRGKQYRTRNYRGLRTI